LKRQPFVGGDAAIAEAMAQQGELVEFNKLDKIIVQDAEDTDIYLLLAGTVTIVLKGNEYVSRVAGQHVGEMAAIEPTLKRSATVVADEKVVALKVSSAKFMAIGDSYPQIWLPMARELSRRLFQRNILIQPPNEFPKLFIISSSEAMPVATELRTQLGSRVFTTIWSEGVFFAGGYPLESLEKAVGESDFAVAIAQADDVVRSRRRMQPTLRDNVVFELGLFMGKLTRHRAILVAPRTPKLKLPSDLHGLTMSSYALGTPADLSDRIKPVAEEILKIVNLYGVRTLLKSQ
jgi:predicted nucleotide-binding protein